jgi:hypothetical protein
MACLLQVLLDLAEHRIAKLGRADHAEIDAVDDLARGEPRSVGDVRGSPLTGLGMDGGHSGYGAPALVFDFNAKLIQQTFRHNVDAGSLRIGNVVSQGWVFANDVLPDRVVGADMKVESIHAQATSI